MDSVCVGMREHVLVIYSELCNLRNPFFHVGIVSSDVINLYNALQSFQIYLDCHLTDLRVYTIYTVSTRLVLR